MIIIIEPIINKQYYKHQQKYFKPIIINGSLPYIYIKTSNDNVIDNTFKIPLSSS